MTRRIALVCLIVSMAVIAPACKSGSPSRPQAESGAELNGNFGGTGPGTLLDARVLPTIDRRLRAATSTAARMQYTSTSGITNAETQVSGTVFAPKGNAPDGGWPIVALAHGTSGLRNDCAPSRSPTLLTLAPIVLGLVGAGYVVTIADYQGLGSGEDYHPYLEPTTEGYNLIDAVRAARKLVPGASDRWVAAGFSQGGQAAWAANELADTYGTGTTFLGSVSLAPPLDLTFIADAAASGTLTNDQKGPYQALLASLKNEYPEFNLDDYRRGIVEQNWDSLLRCDDAHADARTKLIDQIAADDLRPSSRAATDSLHGYLQKMSLPQRATSAPMLVIFGDHDQFIPVDATNRALADACSMGDVIDIRMEPGKGHGDLDFGVALPWLADRFKDVPVTNSCKPPVPEPSSERVVTSQPDGADATQ
jgi:dienelactone hydrolase